MFTLSLTLPLPDFLFDQVVIFGYSAAWSQLGSYEVAGRASDQAVGEECRSLIIFGRLWLDGLDGLEDIGYVHPSPAFAQCSRQTCAFAAVIQCVQYRQTYC